MCTAQLHGRSFQAVQRDFAAFIRDPDGHALPTGIEERRMRLYARLFYNNIESALANAYRVFRSITDDGDWRVLVRGFMRCHRAETPYYLRIPEEFLEYLAAVPNGSLPPFALELCHYEWVKRSLDFAPDAVCDFDDEPVAIDDAICLSPLAWPLRYAYPVQRIGADFRPAVPPTDHTCLIVCRNRHERVCVVESNAVTIRLLGLLGGGNDCRSCFEIIADETGLPLAHVEQSGLTVLDQLHRQDVIVRQEVAGILRQQREVPPSTTSTPTTWRMTVSTTGSSPR